MQRILIATLLTAEAPQKGVTLCGWVRTRRDAREFSFLEVNDGSCLSNIQCIVDAGTPAFAALKEVNTGTAVSVSGDLVASPGAGQRWELRATTLTLLGLADQECYPLQKKRHSDTFLRSIAHLRVRTNKYGAAFRIRSEAAFAVHAFFRARYFHLIHTPILTGSDCEGAGEMFRVTTLPPAQTNLEQDFFGKPCNLTVSGQLEAEALALGLGRVYTFGPTFRAENSNTARHAAEFWMVEPEMAFADLEEDMELGESLTRHVITHVLEHCAADLALFDNFVEPGLLTRLRNMAETPFACLPYREAVNILQKCGQNFAYAVHPGMDLQSEHERYLAEVYCQRPVIVFDYPKDIKAFYMRLNDDMTTVAAMDILVPHIGELIGGSQREERLPVLEQRLREMGQSPEAYAWYLDLRRFGSAPHAGFGLGFERLLMLLTGIKNIRDVLPFPRTPGNLEF